MLYIALVVSAILLLVVNLTARRAERPVGMILAKSIAIGLAAMGVCLIQLPPVLLQAILICIVALIWGATRGKPRHFLISSCAATMVAFAVPGYFAFQQSRHLQEAFPYVSMDDRLPLPRKQLSTSALPTDTADRLNAMEMLIQENDRTGSFNSRKNLLRQIHEETVSVFVNRPGFGVERMPPLTERGLKRGPHDEPPIPQPGAPSPSPWLPEELRKAPASARTANDLLSLHRNSIVDFINLDGFGYIKDRQHVAGFQEHQFSREPSPARFWKLQTLDLIGLLFHEKPIAYVSEHLPRMQELRAASTRDLDEFESVGLDALQRGDDLFVRARGQERRMLGAIRAARQCLSCHQSERGDLLGAFSYRMTLDGK